VLSITLPVSCIVVCTGVVIDTYFDGPAGIRAHGGLDDVDTFKNAGGGPLAVMIQGSTVALFGQLRK